VNIGIGIGIPGGGVVPAFLPTDLPNCLVWLRADKGITLATADVATWANMGTGGSAYNLTQADTTKDPLFVAADANHNGHPSVEFDGVAEWLEGATASGWKFMHDGTGCTLFCRIYDGGAATTKFLLESNAGTKNQTGISWWIVGSAETGNVQCTRSVGGAGNETYTATSAGGNFDAGVHTVVSQYKESSSPEYDLRVDGVSRASGNSLNAPNTGNPFRAPTVGAWRNTSATPAGFFDGSIPEIILYNRVLTAAERTQVTNYLTDRYG